MLLFLSAITIVVIVLGTLFMRHYLNTQRRARARWSELLGRLTPLNKVGIEMVASDLLDGSGQERQDEQAKSLSGEDIWRLVDGMQGLDRVHHNSRVLLDLAAYVLEWHPEAFEAAEQLRIKAQEITWLVDRLRAAEENGSLEGWFANYAQRAVAAYSLMVQSLESLLPYAQQGAVSEFREVIG